MSITRSAQPMVGLGQARSIQDEKLVEAIFSSNSPSAQSQSTSLPNLIIDARPAANAIAQTAMGAGTENTDNYKNSRLVFLNIDNIHIVRDSFARLAEGDIGLCSMFNAASRQELS